MSITTHYVNQRAIVIMPDGSVFEKTVTEKEYQKKIIKMALAGDESGLTEFFKPGIGEKMKEVEAFNAIKEVPIFKDYGNYITIPSISNLSVPQNLAQKIANAYKKGKKKKLEAYLNFWRLASCNPTPAVRENLFWFLQEHHMFISRSGMFLAFRNVHVRPDGSFTDAHTKTMDIRIGVPVSMPREDCDHNQDHTCSSGLHCAAASFMEGSFGDQSMSVLVNPADVIAIPPLDDYKKLRTCAYFPYELLERDENDHPVFPKYKDGFQDPISQDIIQEVIASYGISDKEHKRYTFTAPEEIIIAGVKTMEEVLSEINFTPRVEEVTVDDLLPQIKSNWERDYEEDYGDECDEDYWDDDEDDYYDYTR